MSKEKKYKQDSYLLELKLWPNRSLSNKGFTITMVITGVGLIIPIIPIMSNKVGLAILPFALLTFAFLFTSFIANYRYGNMYEELKISSNLIEIKRVNSDGSIKKWSANPYWIKVNLYEKDRRVKNYLTIKGNGREIELGSFLAPYERVEIKNKIDNVIRKILVS
tara:strand:- start:127 stop:621 length:495 start_codon:yes stop_codon:yes gene_type:complete